MIEYPQDHGLNTCRIARTLYLDAESEDESNITLEIVYSGQCSPHFMANHPSSS